MNNKYKIYLKFLLAFILWIAVFILTRIPYAFESILNIEKQKNMKFVFIFIFIWILICIKYFINISDIYTKLNTNPKLIYVFMDTLFILMLIQDILYLDLSIIGFSAIEIKDPFCIVKLSNIVFLLFYKIRKGILKTKKIKDFIQIIVASIFLLESRTFEIIAIDIFIIIFVQFKKIDKKYLSVIEKVVNFTIIILSICSVILLKFTNVKVVIINLIAITIYITLKILNKARSKRVTT